MRVIIAGCRHICRTDILDAAIDEAGFNITRVVSGCARGVDTMGEDWANAHGIPISRFPAALQSRTRSADASSPAQ